MKPLALGLLIPLFVFPVHLWAAGEKQPDTDLNSVLEGFDDADENDAGLDSVLEGFDDADETDAGLDSVLEGFDDADETDADLDSTPEGFDDAETEESSWQFTGSRALSSSYNFSHKAPKPGKTDYRGLSRLRVKIRLQFDYKWNGDWEARVNGHGFRDFSYGLNGRDQYEEEFLEDMEREVELGEAYILGSPTRNLDVKIGRQIVVWGKSDSIRVTDILNPIDNREPGLVDIEDLRLPLTMLRLDYFLKDWSLSAMIIPEIRFNKNPAFGSDFYALPAPPPDEEIPESSSENSEYALALNGIFSGWDLSFYAADLYDDAGHIFIENGKKTLRHQRIRMFGGAFNVALGSWLFKAEVALFDGLRYSTAPPLKEYVRNDGFLGIDYSGFSDTSLSLEAVVRRIRNYDAKLEKSGAAEENAEQYIVRYTGDFLRQQLRLNILASAFGTSGGFSRLSLDYDLRDALTLTGGVITYQSGTSAYFKKISDNDRVFIEIKYDF